MPNKKDLDPWQKEVLLTEGNIVLRSGRQVGKSTIISIKAGDYAALNSNKSVMIISATERQAYLLFSKVLSYLMDNYKSHLKTGKDRQTKTEIKLKNKSVIRCLPTGLDGIGIRGYTVDLLIADEAAFIPEDVWNAVTPMLATTKVQIILLSTPHGRDNYFYKRFQDPKFTPFHISSEDCPRIDKDFLKFEKETKSKREYAQEYLWEFVDELMQFFPDWLIKECMIKKREEKITPSYHYYLGVDVARMGGDESTFEIIEKKDKKIIQKENITKKYTLLTETQEMIKELDNKYNFKYIYIDDGGLGAGVVDNLLKDEILRRKVKAINNARREIEYTGDKNRKTKLMKEALYSNLLSLMEKKELELLDDAEIFLSLKSVQYEYDEKGTIRIFGKYTHIVEGLIRACWCVKDKHLNIYLE